MIPRAYLFFDIDYTLFDTYALISFAKIPPLPGQIFTKMRSKDFDWNKINPNNLLYPKTIDTLIKLRKQGYLLNIFSEGDIWGQQFKIKFTGLDKFFDKDNIYIFEDKKLSHLADVFGKISDLSQVYFFDDKPDYLEFIKKNNPEIKIVLLCQGPCWNKPTKIKPDYKIKNISEILYIL